MSHAVDIAFATGYDHPSPAIDPEPISISRPERTDDMYAGDQGPLTVTRVATINGLVPSEKDPLRDECKFLEPLDPNELVPKAKAFLAQLGINKPSELGDRPAM